MLWDGATLIAEYDNGNALQRRYVFGPGTDEPLVRYEGTGTSDRHWYHADERGSVIATSDGSGAVTGVNTYDEYGIPGSGNTGRFQYTGQQWLSDIGMYYHRARLYSPTFGRFLQTDPIGYGGGMNLYAYVRNDPLNFTDPLGLDPPQGGDDEETITVNGRRRPKNTHGCDEGFIRLGSVCVTGVDLRTIFETSTTVTFTALGTPNIGPDTSCTVNGNSVTCPLDQPTVEQRTTCEQVRNEQGGILAVSFGGSGVLGRGVTGSVGQFSNLRTGSTGYFATYGISTGLDLNAGASVSYYRSLTDFSGYNDNITLAGTPAWVNFAFTDISDLRSLVGASVGPSFGLGATYSSTYTVLFGCSNG